MKYALVAKVEGKTLTLQVSGELTREVTDQFRREVAAMLKADLLRVEVNCRDLTFVDSSGLGAFIFLRKRACEAGGQLYLTEIKGWLLKFLQVTGLEETFMSPERKVRG